MNNGCQAPLYSTYGRGFDWLQTLLWGLMHAKEWHGNSRLPHD